jgi:hypothetical protein
MYKCITMICLQVVNIRFMKCHACLNNLKHFGSFSLFCKHNCNYSVDKELRVTPFPRQNIQIPTVISYLTVFNKFSIVPRLCLDPRIHVFLLGFPSEILLYKSTLQFTN